MLFYALKTLQINFLCNFALIGGHFKLTELYLFSSRKLQINFSMPFLLVKQTFFANPKVMQSCIFSKFKNSVCRGRGSPTCTVSTNTISTNTNFQKVVHKVVLVGDLFSKFVLIELTLCTTQLVQISHSKIFSRSQKLY